MPQASGVVIEYKGGPAASKERDSGGRGNAPERVFPFIPSLIGGFKPSATRQDRLFIVIGTEGIERLPGHVIHFSAPAGLLRFDPPIMFPKDWESMTYVFVVRGQADREPMRAVARYWVSQGRQVRVLDLPLTFPETDAPLVNGQDFDARVAAILETNVIKDIRGEKPVEDVEAIGDDSVCRVNISEGERHLIAALSQYQPGQRLVIAIDPGGGKTHRMALMAKELAPMLFLSPTRALSRAFADQAMGVSDGARLAVFTGRNDDLCHRLDEVAALGTARRSIAANLCGSCKHGLLTMRDRGSPTAEETIRKREEAGEVFPDDLPRCGYVEQVQDVRTADILVAAEASLAGSPTHLLRKESEKVHGKKKTTMQRTIVWDDCFTPFTAFEVSIADLAKWRERGMSVLENVMAPDEQKEWVSAIGPVLGRLIQILFEKPAHKSLTEMNPPEGLSWSQAAERLATYPEEAKSVDGLVLETIRRDEADPAIKDIPLRAVTDLARAIRNGTVWADKTVLRCTIPTLSLDTFASEGGIVLDATPSPIVRALADTIVEIRLDQDSLSVEQDVSELRGRGNLREPGALEAATKRLISDGKNEGLIPDHLAVITHLPIARALRETDSNPFGHVGHWGAHQRGHNDYLDVTTLLLDGVPIPPPDATMRDYESTRLYLAAIGKATWNPWTGDRTLVKVRHNGIVRDVMRYSNRDLDGFMRDMIAAEVVQAIGRLRATRRKGVGLTVRILSSFLLPTTYGLEINKVVGATSLKNKESFFERYVEERRKQRA